MKQVYLVLGVIAAVLLLGGCWFISERNALVALDEDVNKAWADIDAQLQRRADLIDNLVETVKGAAAHEEDVFLGIANARSKIGSPNASLAEKAEADAELSNCLSRLLVIAEAYPELKANENFLRFQDELAGTANRITVSRTRYNDQVTVYNRRIRQFPGSFFAGTLGLEKREYFNPPQGHAAVENAPKVDFSKNNNGNNASNNGGGAN